MPASASTRSDTKESVGSQLPGLGSVKLAFTLPRSVCYDSHVKLENGRW